MPVAHWPTGTNRKYCIRAGFFAEVVPEPPLGLTEKVAATLAINHDSPKSFVGVNKVPKPGCFPKTRAS